MNNFPTQIFQWNHRLRVFVCSAPMLALCLLFSNDKITKTMEKKSYTSHTHDLILRLLSLSSVPQAIAANSV